MEVTHTSRTSATMRNGSNTVVMYCDPAGEVYVNGHSMPDSGGIESTGGTLLVPDSLIRRIAAILRYKTSPEPTRPPAHVPTGPRRTVTVRPRVPMRILGKVVIDPGHGGKDPGTKDAYGRREKDLVLKVGKMVAQELQARGVQVIMTRSDDTFLELEDRPAIAARNHADLFVSIHADWAKNSSAQGFTAYVDRTPSKGSIRLANAILHRMCASCSPSRGVKNADYRVLVHSRTPAVLIELGFMSNRTEARRLAGLDYQHTLARAIAEGICETLR